MSDDPRAEMAARIDALKDVSTDDRWLDISKHRGAPKAAVMSHSDPDNRTSGMPPDGYYGVYTTGEDPLVILDVDDYGDDGADPDGLGALVLKLKRENPTLVTESAHGGEHHFYRVVTEGYSPIAGVLDERLGVPNPDPSWGEVLVANKYCLGPGTTLEDCNKDHEKLDTPPCSGAGGHYSIKEDNEIATITAEDLLYVLRQDADIDDAGHEPDQRSLDDTGGDNSAETVRERIQVARKHDASGIIDNVLDGNYTAAGYTSEDGSADRSEAECALAAKLGFWLGDKSSVEKALDDVYDRGKWARRGDDYRRTVLQYAETSETFDWDDDNEPTKTRGPEPSADASDNSAGDGGTATQSTTATSDGSDSQLSLSPRGLVQMAINDPYGRLNPDKDVSVHDLRTSEAATHIWQLLEARNDDDVLYSTNGEFYRFDEDRRVWNRDNVEGDSQLLRDLGRQAAQTVWSTRLKSELHEEVKARNSYHVDELGIGEPWLVCEGTAVNLKSREQRAVNKEDIAVRSINSPFDRDAEPDQWLRFLTEVTTSPDAVDKLQEYFGYCLWHHGQPFGKALFLTGPTDSGKGTTLQVLTEILGDENVANETLQDLVETRWSTAKLFGRMANIRNEITPGSLRDPQMFKELTGAEDSISAELKGKQKFEFTVKQKFLFSTNQFPEIEEADDAFWNRCLFVRMPDTIPPEEQNAELVDELLDEREGIVNWMLEGLDRLFEQGGFTGERDLDAKRDIADEHGGALQRFKSEALTITGSENDIVHAKELHNAVTRFGETEGLDDAPSWQGGAFTSEMRRWAGVKTVRSRRVADSGEARAFAGVQVDEEVIHRLGVDVTTDTLRGNGQSSL